MSLFSIELSNWRAFRDKVGMAVKPLTLIYGHNQAGKSSLLRSLPLLADSIFEEAGPINMKSAAMAGMAFDDFRWQRKAWPTWGLSVGSGDNAAAIATSFSEAGGLIVNRFELYQPSGRTKRNEFLVDWSKTVKYEGGRLFAKFAGKHHGQDWDSELEFSSFFPQGLPSAAIQRMEHIKAALAPLRNIQWLQANRVALPAKGRRDIQKGSRCCAEDGSDLARIMLSGHLAPVLKRTAEWCSTQELMADTLRVVEDQGTSAAQFYLGRLGLSELPLHLAGEGMRSLLPILLCANWADLSREQPELIVPGPSMLAIEEPESHLHPHWQLALFERLLETAKKGTPVILETHSVHLLRAMQRAVLQEKITPAEIGLYWVAQDQSGIAELQTIEVQADASLPGWRPDVFETEQELAHQILDLRWKRGRA